jgi:hypothetical protein
MVMLGAAVALLCFGGAALADQGSTASVALGAHTSFDRTWNWVVTKTDDQHSAVTLAQNQVASITYTVTVANGNPAFTDSNWQVQDGIPISSTAPFTIDSLSNIAVTALQDGGSVQSSGSVSVCSLSPTFVPPVTIPFTGSFVSCHYVIPLADGTAGTVTAKVTFSDGSTATGSGPFDFASHLEPGQPVIHNASVNVTDTVGGSLGTVTAPAGLHTTFQYSVPVDTSTCGSFDLPNTVNLTDTVTGANVAHATDTVHVTVTCPHVNGCTLTQGYWKTHSIYGPASKADPAWNLLPGGLGPDTPFFLSGQTWLGVFNTSPAGGNPYYVLAHQYEAAVLNQLNGASSTGAVDAALADAKSFLSTYTPTTAGLLAKNSPIRQAALNDAAVLDSYNSGLIGPGHCSE